MVVVVGMEAPEMAPRSFETDQSAAGSRQTGQAFDLEMNKVIYQILLTVWSKVWIGFAVRGGGGGDTSDE